MPGGAPENEKMKDAFDEHSMAHSWKTGTGFGPAGGSDGSIQESPGTTYHAACQDCPGNGTSGGWMGPNRPTRDQAQADADAHNESHPGHTAMVI
jgi:hypothetical protein